MRFTQVKLTVFLTASLVVGPVFAASNVRHSSTRPSAPSSVSHKSAIVSTHHTTKSRKLSATASRKTVAAHRTRLHGQQAIEPDRVTQIQEALIREHYMDGEPNGNWDADTVAAMQKYQADHGWQTKLMPDSRALKNLGLGPDYSSAINAKDSSFNDPPPVSSIPNDQAAGFSVASGVDQ